MWRGLEVSSRKLLGALGRVCPTLRLHSKALLLFCLLLPLACLPFLPRTKVNCLFFLLSLPCGWLCATQTPWPRLPHLFWGCCLNRHKGQGQHKARTGLPLFREPPRPKESKALPKSCRGTAKPCVLTLYPASKLERVFSWT